MINDYDPNNYIINVREIVLVWVIALAFMGVFLPDFVKAAEQI